MPSLRSGIIVRGSLTPRVLLRYIVNLKRALSFLEEEILGNRYGCNASFDSFICRLPSELKYFPF